MGWGLVAGLSMKDISVPRPSTSPISAIQGTERCLIFPSIAKSKEHWAAPKGISWRRGKRKRKWEMGSSYRKAASCGQGRNGEKMKNNSWVQRGGEEEKEGIGAHGSREREAAVLGRPGSFCSPPERRGYQGRELCLRLPQPGLGKGCLGRGWRGRDVSYPSGLLWGLFLPSNNKHGRTWDLR